MGQRLRTVAVLILFGVTLGGSSVPGVIPSGFALSLAGHNGSLLILGSIERPETYPVTKTSIGIWEDVVSKSPNKPRPHLNLGRSYYENGLYEAALVQYRAAIAVSMHQRDGIGRTTRQLAATNMSQILLKFGRLDVAEQVLVEVWNEEPGYPGIANNLAIVYANQGKLQLALEVIDAGLQVQEHYGGFIDQGQMWTNRGTLLRELGRCEEANRSFAIARTFPDSGAPPDCNT